MCEQDTIDPGKVGNPKIVVGCPVRRLSVVDITLLGHKLGWTNESKRPQDCVVLGFACGEPRKEMKTNGNCGYVYDTGAAFVVPHRKDNDPPIPSVGGWWSQTIPSRPESFSASTNMTSCHYETGTAKQV